MGLELRQAEVDDAYALREIYAQQHVYANTLQLPYPPISLWEERLDETHPDLQSLVACQDERVVGHLNLKRFETPRRHHAATFGMAVDRKWLRQGIVSSLVGAALDLADHWLDIKRLELEVYVHNDAAVALYKKFGFLVEGECRGYAFRAGKYVDIYRMARVNFGDDLRTV